MNDFFFWVISTRSEILTDIFKIFPLFASDGFYILLISIGHWQNFRDRLFWHLGFLVPFSTLLSCTLKNLFSIPRPNEVFHLIAVHDPFGFPSGDILVATVFWGMMCLSKRSRTLWTLAFSLITLMMFSRIYLGVHTLYDVIGGFIFGILTLLFYRSKFFQHFVSQWSSGQLKTFGIGVGLFTLMYVIVSFSLSTPPMVIMALGALIGYGASLYSNAKTSFSSSGTPRIPANLIYMALSLGILACFVWSFPVLREGNPLFVWGLGLIKYACVVVLIFILLPRFQCWLFQRLHQSKSC